MSVADIHLTTVTEVTRLVLDEVTFYEINTFCILVSYKIPSQDFNHADLYDEGEYNKSRGSSSSFTQCS